MDTWSSNSFNRGTTNSTISTEMEPSEKNLPLGVEEPTPPQPQERRASLNNKSQERNNPSSTPTAEKHTEPEEESKITDDENLSERVAREEPIPPQPHEQTAPPNNVTPKRKLSPTPMTPTGKPRKLTTEMYCSPLLKGVLETVGMHQHEESVPQAPDLLEGIGQLRPGASTGHQQMEAQSSAPDVRNPLRIFKKAGSRIRAMSMAENLTKETPKRRQGKNRRLSERDISTPLRQMKITDTFRAQQDLLENKEDA